MNFRNYLHSDPLYFRLPETGTALDFPVDFSLEMNRRPEIGPIVSIGSVCRCELVHIVYAARTSTYPA
eukprot:4142066-Prymnesium_polylepis.1